MRSFSRLTVLTVALAAACALGCSDGDKDKKDAGRSDARARDSKARDSGPLTSACANAADGLALNAKYGDGGGMTIADIAGACGLKCVTTPTTTCVNTCIGAATSNKLSAGCTTCFSNRLVCTIVNCVSVCATAPTSAACAACGCGNNTAKKSCVAEFESCSGVPSSSECPSANDGGVKSDAKASSDATVHDAQHEH